MNPTPLSKAQQRRQHLLRTATEVFCELGYDGASMSAIAAKAGGSKGTLYNYFPSKEKLLLAAILEGADEFQEDIMVGVDLHQPLKPLLTHIVNRILHKVYVEPRTVKLLRVVISVSDRTDVGRQFFDVLGNSIWVKIHELLSNDKPASQHADNMTSYLRGLCEVDLMRLLMGAMPNLTPEQAQTRTERIIEDFFQIYA